MAEPETACMLLFALIPFLASAALAEEPSKPVIVTAYPWAPFISPMGEPFRSRAPDDDPFARWFHQADGNQDGMLTADEMRADAERFFAMLDGNRDGRIDSEERMTYESEIAPEVQSNSRWKRTRQETAAEARSGDDSDRRDRRRRRANNIDGYQLDGLQGAARYGLLNLPEPVSGADADFDRFVSLDEFRRAASYRFQLLDSGRSGRLTLKQLEALVPTRPKDGRRAKRPKNAVDTRIGIPVPLED
ncbi:MAG: EF-hand domain-containing protein [Pseudomonadota bacterium]|nr:EF-hand domain-containing protein [Pseudomonadota bacterium]